jgi:hypothetical protein
MSTDSEQDDLPKNLTRAFLCAWEQYCEADPIGRLSEEVARPFLEGFLVGSAREGMTDEGQLVAASLRYLISLTPKPTSSKRSTKDEKTIKDGRWPVRFCINRAPAKFVPLMRIAWRPGQETAHVLRRRRFQHPLPMYA